MLTKNSSPLFCAFRFDSDERESGEITKGGEKADRLKILKEKVIIETIRILKSLPEQVDDTPELLKSLGLIFSATENVNIPYGKEFEEIALPELLAQLVSGSISFVAVAAMKVVTNLAFSDRSFVRVFLDCGMIASVAEQIRNEPSTEVLRYGISLLANLVGSNQRASLQFFDALDIIHLTNLVLDSGIDIEGFVRVIEGVTSFSFDEDFVMRLIPAIEAIISSKKNFNRTHMIVIFGHLFQYPFFTPTLRMLEFLCTCLRSTRRGIYLSSCHVIVLLVEQKKDSLGLSFEFLMDGLMSKDNEIVNCSMCTFQRLIKVIRPDEGFVAKYLQGIVDIWGRKSICLMGDIMKTLFTIIYTFNECLTEENAKLFFLMALNSLESDDSCVYTSAIFLMLQILDCAMVHGGVEYFSRLILENNSLETIEQLAETTDGIAAESAKYILDLMDF